MYLILLYILFEYTSNFLRYSETTETKATFLHPQTDLTGVTHK